MEVGPLATLGGAQYNSASATWYLAHGGAGLSPAPCPDGLGHQAPLPLVHYLA